jgi:hypothetical protein
MCIDEHVSERTEAPHHARVHASALARGALSEPPILSRRFGRQHVSSESHSKNVLTAVRRLFQFEYLSRDKYSRENVSIFLRSDAKQYENY